MVRPDRDQLSGDVEVDETYLGEEEPGVIAVEMNEGAIGRIRLRQVPAVNAASLHGFIVDVVKPGSADLAMALAAEGYVVAAPTSRWNGMEQHGPSLPLDFVDLLAAFGSAGVRYLIIGESRGRARVVVRVVVRVRQPPDRAVE